MLGVTLPKKRVCRAALPTTMRITSTIVHYSMALPPHLPPTTLGATLPKKRVCRAASPTTTRITSMIVRYSMALPPNPPSTTLGVTLLEKQRVCQAALPTMTLITSTTVRYSTVLPLHPPSTRLGGGNITEGNDESFSGETEEGVSQASDIDRSSSCSYPYVPNVEYRIIYKYFPASLRHEIISG